MTRRTGRLVVAAAAFALVAPAPAGAATGAPEKEGAVETGVWWQGNRGGLAVPPPPVLVDIPDGGLWLSSGPNGDTGSSAVRFQVSDHAVPEELVLRIHQGSSTEPVVALCAPTNEWKPPDEQPGAWDDRAVPDCDRFSTVGVVDGDTIRFPLTDLQDDDVDLVLTRVPDDSESYLNVTFKPPLADDLRTSSPVSSGGFVPPPATPPDPPAEGTGSTGSEFVSDVNFDPGTIGVMGNDGSSGADPTLGGPAGDPVPPEDVTEADPSAESAIAAAKPAAADEAWDSARWIALAALVLIGGWMTMLASQRFRSGIATAPYTIYRGTPPR